MAMPAEIVSIGVLSARGARHGHLWGFWDSGRSTIKATDSEDGPVRRLRS
jgi:hypothetical protein